MLNIKVKTEDNEKKEEEKKESSNSSFNIKKIQNQQNSLSNYKRLENSSVDSRESKSLKIDFRKSDKAVGIEKWIAENLLKDLTEKIKDYDYLQIYSKDEYGKELEVEQFISNLLKAVLKREDLEIFQKNLENIISQINLLIEERDLNRNLRKDTKKLKEINLDLLNKTVPKLMVIRESLGNFRGEIRELLEEEANERESGEFLVAFSVSFRELLTILALTKKFNENSRLEIIYKITEKFFKSISGKYAVNRKRLLSQLADYITKHFENYRFVSPEDYTFVDGRFHNIVKKEGQKIKEGLSFGVLRKDTLQVIKYANVITF